MLGFSPEFSAATNEHERRRGGATDAQTRFDQSGDMHATVDLPDPPFSLATRIIRRALFSVARTHFPASSQRLTPCATWPARTTARSDVTCRLVVPLAFFSEASILARFISRCALLNVPAGSFSKDMLGIEF